MLNACNEHGGDVFVIYSGFSCPMCEGEKTNLDLEDKISLLEEELQVANERIKELEPNG